FHGYLPTERTGKQREQIVKAVVLDDSEDATPPAQPYLAGTLVKTSQDNPYGVEIQVRPAGGTAYLARQPVVRDGQALGELKRDEVYKVRVNHSSAWDAAVQVHVDGLNAFHFSKNKEYEHFLVPKGKAGSLRGWYRDNRQVDLFEVKSWLDSVTGSNKLPA